MQPNVHLLLDEGRKNISSAHELFDRGRFAQAERTATTALFQMSQALMLCVINARKSSVTDLQFSGELAQKHQIVDVGQILSLSKDHLMNNNDNAVDGSSQEALLNKSKSAIKSAVLYLSTIEEIIRNEDLIATLANET